MKRNFTPRIGPLALAAVVLLGSTGAFTGVQAQSLDELERRIQEKKEAKAKREAEAAKAEAARKAESARAEAARRAEESRQASLLVRSDAECMLSVGGQAVGVVKPGETRELRTASGEQIIDCRSSEFDQAAVSLVKPLRAGEQSVVLLELAAKVGLERQRALEQQKRQDEQARARKRDDMRRNHPPGAVFQECADCPEMVVIPAGSFQMGSKLNSCMPESANLRFEYLELARSSVDEFRKLIIDCPEGNHVARVLERFPELRQSIESLDPDAAPLEAPRHPVAVGLFALGRTHVTRHQFQKFLTATGHQVIGRCTTKEKDWRTLMWGQAEDHPVVCIAWVDAVRYVEWLSGLTGARYRLPSEAEWEYAARAGTATWRHWGNNTEAACAYGNVLDQGGLKVGDNVPHQCADGYPRNTAPVMRFAANAFGLHDTAGNAMQWMQDCYHPDYSGAPVTGAPRLDGDCTGRVLRGASPLSGTRQNRVAYRHAAPHDFGSDLIGLRVARDFP